MDKIIITKFTRATCYICIIKFRSLLKRHKICSLQKQTFFCQFPILHLRLLLRRHSARKKLPFSLLCKFQSQNQRRRPTTLSTKERAGEIVHPNFLRLVLLFSYFFCISKLGFEAEREERLSLIFREDSSLTHDHFITSEVGSSH